MSKERVEHDFYPTPGWCVRQLLDEIGHELPWGEGPWLEPCVGDGAIVRAVDGWALENGKPEVEWVITDIRTTPLVAEPLDFLLPELRRPQAYALAFTNPPFVLAHEFAEACLHDARQTIFLLRLAFLGSADRNDFIRANPPAVEVMPNRPSFVHGSTDSHDYGWFKWGFGAPIVHTLRTWPKDKRRTNA